MESKRSHSWVDHEYAVRGHLSGKERSVSIEHQETSTYFDWIAAEAIPR